MAHSENSHEAVSDVEEEKALDIDDLEYFRNNTTRSCIFSEYGIPGLEEDNEYSAVSKEIKGLLSNNQSLKRVFIERLNPSFMSEHSLMVGDTPLSVVCAKHVDTIRQDMDSSKLVHVLSLVFFCSRQRDNHRENTGTSMIRSFIAQLIRLHKELNLGILSLEKQSSAGQAIIRERKVEDLCLEFRNLVKAFGPTTTIVCFIEGLGFCRERNYWAEVNTVISCLDELVSESEVDYCTARFKLICTSPVVTWPDSFCLRQ